MTRPMSEEREPCPKLREAIENGHLRCSVSVGVGSPVATIDTEDLWRLVHAAERYASTSSAERGMREALEALLDDAITRQAWVGLDGDHFDTECTCPYHRARAALSSKGEG